MARTRRCGQGKAGNRSGALPLVLLNSNTQPAYGAFAGIVTRFTLSKTLPKGILIGYHVYYMTAPDGIGAANLQSDGDNTLAYRA